MKIFAQKTTISQSVDTLVTQLDQGVHSDKRMFIRDKLPAIFEVAVKQEEKRVKDLKVKAAEMDRLNQEIDDLQQKVDAMDDWIDMTNSQSELSKQKLISLLKYIEPRQVEPGREIAYLVAFSEGKNAEYLEAFIVK